MRWGGSTKDATAPTEPSRPPPSHTRTAREPGVGGSKTAPHPLKERGSTRLSPGATQGQSLWTRASITAAPWEDEARLGSPGRIWHSETPVLGQKGAGGPPYSIRTPPPSTSMDQELVCSRSATPSQTHPWQELVSKEQQAPSPTRRIALGEATKRKRPPVTPPPPGCLSLPVPTLEQWGPHWDPLGMRQSRGGTWSLRQAGDGAVNCREPGM